MRVSTLFTINTSISKTNPINLLPHLLNKCEEANYVIKPSKGDEAVA